MGQRRQLELHRPDVRQRPGLAPTSTTTSLQDGDEIVLVYTDNPVVSIVTNFGSIVMELYEATTPITVENFLSYVNDGDYLDSIFHRSDPGFRHPGRRIHDRLRRSSPALDQFTAITSHGQIQNESSISNVHGTVAMARTSAT